MRPTTERTGKRCVAQAIANSHAMVIGRVNMRPPSDRTGWGNLTFVTISTHSVKVNAALTHFGVPSRKNVGATRFHVAGKPRNQLSSVIMSVRENQMAERNTTSPTSGSEMGRGRRWN